jgi:hypothetical protein
MALELVLVDKATGLAVPIDSIIGMAVNLMPRGYDKQYRISAMTGTIAAALAANGCLFAMRLSPSAPGDTNAAHIQRISLSWTTIAAFTVPVTAARRLEIHRGNSAAATTGTQYNAGKKMATIANSFVDVAKGGDARIAATGTLTTTGIVFEQATATTPPIGVMSLSHLGAAGAFYEKIFDFTAPNTQTPELNPGELIAIRNPVAMDAGGTFQLAVEVDFYEA